MPKTILICDDDKSILEVMQIIFEEKGYNVVIISKSRNIYSEVEKKLPDIILIDLWMPDLDGEEIVRQLKNQKSTKNIPIIVISASNATSQIAKRAGADDYLTKPFDITTLEKKVESHLNGDKK